MMQCGFGQPATALVNRKGPQQDQLHPGGGGGGGGKDLIPCFDSKLAIAQLVRKTNLLLAGRMVALRTVQVRHPDLRPMFAQNFLNHSVASARTDHVNTHFVVLEDPFPLVLTLYPRPSFVTTNQAAPTQSLHNLYHLVIQASLDPLKQIGQGSFTDSNPKHLVQQPRQALVTDCMGVAQVDS